MLGPSAVLGQLAARSLLLLHVAQRQLSESSLDGVELSLNLPNAGVIGCGGAGCVGLHSPRLVWLWSCSLPQFPCVQSQEMRVLAVGWPQRQLPDPNPQHQ